ncbi:hypothetical protein AJ85_16780 [Alkalihalobacillus alcalophilus ATCC 27647 = CGMCC 1.3604]|uniref:Uncharacterized protein n=1 Tax=Alkalihalobacillus alcalophilus ATCC 27647 = CGMCC 1.3604 TaxID=1218173 RepID=A0A094WEV6_ALKAL|nr:hypothetical protein [Alkalihalobacillus alcalophilus]KGA96264.1 hypothetical protein BALCAV_0217270 [Alkalihalobacillus alcalophilus ATCC 27647 = CGMCC 1.3604]MED1563600.1 hypothetical protein [Alkalihalobacillus alcalophilus]THG89563.1 hypothetical protein AJ85_16780 [Alkalihalobacillus alcalophilus ATCC 27647 = CGMCC 1.3604]
MGRKKQNIEKQKVLFHLYLNPYIRESNTRIYDVLLQTYNRTYEAIYKDIKENPKKIYDVHLKEANATIHNQYCSEYADPSDYYEQLQEYVVERVQEQSLMHYQFKLMSLSNLYQVFEQQLRKWLFEEMTHSQNEYTNQIKFVLKYEEDTYSGFYNNFRILTNLLKEMNLTFPMQASETGEMSEWEIFFNDVEDKGKDIPIVQTEIWNLIRECNLISNTYKHGSGNSAKALYKIRPEYFEKVSDTKLMNLYRTTNMEEVLSVDKICFETYSTVMKTFWEKLKEHQSGFVLMEIDMSPEEE